MKSEISSLDDSNDMNIIEEKRQNNQLDEKACKRFHGLSKDFIKDDFLDECIVRALPPNYNFEIHKSLWKINETNSTHVILQMPEGLLQWSQQIAEILTYFSRPNIIVSILGDVTYGACCIEDVIANLMKGDLLIHYGHSCLISMNDLIHKNLSYLYVFVDIYLNPVHFVNTIKYNFKYDANIAILGTIQYNSIIHAAKRLLNKEQYFSNPMIPFIPQEIPLSSSEVLGCTSPIISRIDQNLFQNNHNDTGTNSSIQDNKLFGKSPEIDGNNIYNRHSIFNRTIDKILPKDISISTQSENIKNIDCAIFVSDGRFHMESAMIQNPNMNFYKYDPFTKLLTTETYDFKALHRNRCEAINKAKKAKIICLILSTLGRQGSVGILERIQDMLIKKKKTSITMLLSEISPKKLIGFEFIDAFIQIGCPRLSIDWGSSFHLPLLSPYEAYVAFGDYPYIENHYPMDYYSKNGGPWSNNYQRRNGSLSLSEAEIRAFLKERLRIRKKRETIQNLSYDT